jgi:hypothetical protein
MSNVTEMPSPEAKLGKRIMLGQVQAEIEFPNNKVLKIKRMPMSAELRFVELYNEMVEKIKASKSEIFEKIRAYMDGAKAVNFGLVEGLEMVGQLFGQLEGFQNGLIEAVMVIVDAQKSDITRDELKEHLSTADALEILSAQSEVQGLLGSFRSIISGLNPQGVLQG